MDLNTFEANLKGKTVLVDFGAIWCAPCQAMAPTIKQIENKYKDRISIFKVNIDLERNLAKDYMIQSVPTLIFFKNGREVHRMIGLQSASELEDQIKTILNNN